MERDYYVVGTMYGDGLVGRFASIPMFVGVRRKAGVGGWRRPGDGDMDGGSNAS